MTTMNDDVLLTERLELRIDAQTKRELERLAALEERKPGALARRFVRAGVAAALESDGQHDGAAAVPA